MISWLSGAAVVAAAAVASSSLSELASALRSALKSSSFQPPGSALVRSEF